MDHCEYGNAIPGHGRYPGRHLSRLFDSQLRTASLLWPLMDIDSVGLGSPDELRWLAIHCHPGL